MEVRSEAEIIKAFRDLAEECEKRSNPEDIPDRFQEAYVLMLEARVPRMPDSQEELQEMLDAAINDPRPSVPAEEAFASIKAGLDARLSFKGRFDAQIAAEAFESAAMMLAPCKGCTGPGFYGRIAEDFGYYRLTMDTHGYDDGLYQGGPGCVIHHPISSGGGPMVKAFAPTPGLAMLAAILKAHAEWHELWKG